MNTWMMSTRGRGARWAAVGIVSLLTAAGLASSASAEHSLLEQVSTGPTGGNGAFEREFRRCVGRRDAGLLRRQSSRW